MKKLLTTAAVLATLTTQATAAWWWESGFTDADIDAMTKSIKDEFEKREGVKVIEV
jgi:N-acetylglutamate synthase-like GNAT family acetyltransferase